MTLALAGCLGGCASELPATPPGTQEATQKASAIAGEATLIDTKITYYTLVTEGETSGQNTGDASEICNATGLSGCYRKEFLCSGWGVPMQGTGIGHDNRFIHYVRGGTWGPRKRWLNDCSKARFEYITKVTGKSGRELIPHYSVAVDKNLIPLGWSIWIDAEQAWFRADDTGNGIIGKHIDIYRGLDSAQVVADWSTIYATPQPHDWDDLSPWSEPGTGMSSMPGPSPGTGSTTTQTTASGWPQFTCGVNLDGWGTCDHGPAAGSDYAYWCENGVVMYKECSDLGMDCGVYSSTVGVYCLPAGSVTRI